ncbi:hypothetical protein BJY21_001678 [Kineosphaera limosa]|uniref:NAD-dependent epimerase/dehydratase family protein n=1 Tax=Kineosphaera limosa NBRC 100340 TaxID=1184609 RepID=K6W770_9MICO|nr:TIGR01777 family oxidoreductase [Kineosphaera limosa]NYE00494.1 hypothetical protein [Kineosphaera limosa]GAB95040.1 hypothetical protein KILIM_015_01020 [Kineosphaera limosa NBRC 100340]
MAIESATVLDAPIEDVFAWHERPGAIRRLLAPWAPMDVAQESRSLADGVAELKLARAVPWTSRHVAADYNPPYRFVDDGEVPLLGQRMPWRHVHDFERVPASAGQGERTRVIDRIETPVPGSALRQMVAYRHRQLHGDFAVHADMRELAPDPLTIGITGASGLVGTALAALLSTGGHRVVRLVRSSPRSSDERQWNPADPAPDLLAGLDAVVHLAGAPIAGRFTDKHRAAVRDSRVGPTARLARVAGGMPFISASAIGFYGADRGDEQLDEFASRGDGFLADVVEAWEADARQAAGRNVSVRTGIVQSARGGAMALQRPLFAAGLGGPMAGGEQWLSWIALDDLIDIFYRAIVDDRIEGPVNAVAPHPERQRDWARTMGRVMRRPAILPTPEFGPKLILGDEGVREVAAASQRVVPARLQEIGHLFRFPHLEAALRHELGHTTDSTVTRATS